MPRKKRITSAATVGMTHLRSFSFSAGRKNAMISQMMIGVQMIMPKKNATLKRIVKPPRTVRTWSFASSPRMLRRGSSMNSIKVGVAK